MRRLFLHAGEPKTGTSAIQLLLRENRDALEQLGYLVPNAGSNPSGNYVSLIDAILQEPVPPAYSQCVEAFEQEVNSHPAENIVVSAECLDHYFRNDEKRDRLLSFLRDLRLATTILIFIRPDAEALSSAYAEQVKSFLYDVTFPEFVVRRRRYVHLLKLMQLPGIQTIFRPYNAEVRRLGAGREFLRVIGLSEDALQCLGRESRVNQSVGPIAVAAAREIRTRIQQSGRLPTDRQRRALRAELFRLTQEEDPEEPFYGVNAELFDQIERRVAANREKFAQAAWGKSWKTVFASDEAGPKCNAFSAATAEPDALKKYQRMTAALWSAAERIMNDPRRSKRYSWDRLRAHAGCLVAIAHLLAEFQDSEIFDILDNFISV